MLLCINVAEVLAIFIDTDTRIKAIQIGDHEFKIVHFADDTAIFLKNFCCRSKWSYELFQNYAKKFLAQKKTFQKVRPYGV